MDIEQKIATLREAVENARELITVYMEKEEYIAIGRASSTAARLVDMHDELVEKTSNARANAGQG